MKNNSIQQLEKIKKKLEALKEEQMEENARKKVILESLKKEFNCKTLEEAEKLLKKRETELETRKLFFEKLENRVHYFSHLWMWFSCCSKIP